MKPGRNDPCPCGSGKKYKHCHLKPDEMPSGEDPVWRRLRRAIDELNDRLAKTAARHFGPEGIAEAWDEFTLWDEEVEPLDPDSPHMGVFMSWLLYDWLPDPDDTEVPPAAQKTKAAEACMLAVGRHLDPEVKRYVEACLAAPFSFYEVVRCDPGHGFRLRDVLLRSEYDVLERSASAQVEVGDILFAKVAAMGEIAMLDACGPVPFPPVDKPRVIELRAQMQKGGGPLTAEALRDYDLELRELYLELTDELLDPTLPMMQNTDGDPIEMHEIIFDIDSARGAFDALKDLAMAASEEELLEHAELDASGALSRVEIPWRKPGNAMHTSWESTTAGMLEIVAGRLSAVANSARRAEELRRLVEERLGASVRHRSTTTTSLESLMEHDTTPEEQAVAQKREEENARLAEMPEVKAAMAEMARAHYRKWVDESIPALGDRTPREAVGDADGREAVEALVLQLERDGMGQRPALDPSVVRELRETLGLRARS